MAAYVGHRQVLNGEMAFDDDTKVVCSAQPSRMAGKVYIIKHA